MKYNKKTVEIITLISSIIIFVMIILLIKGFVIIQTKSPQNVETENKIINY